MKKNETPLRFHRIMTSKQSNSVGKRAVKSTTQVMTDKYIIVEGIYTKREVERMAQPLNIEINV